MNEANLPIRKEKFVHKFSSILNQAQLICINGIVFDFWDKMSHGYLYIVLVISFHGAISAVMKQDHEGNDFTDRQFAFLFGRISYNMSDNPGAILMFDKKTEVIKAIEVPPLFNLYAVYESEDAHQLYGIDHTDDKNQIMIIQL